MVDTIKNAYWKIIKFFTEKKTKNKVIFSFNDIFINRNY